jgi:acyl-CoA thioesterase FadM
VLKVAYTMGFILNTILDELAGWIVLIKLKTAGVTASMNVEYIKPLTLSKGEVTVRGRIVSVEKRTVQIECTLYDGEGVEYAKSSVILFLLTRKSGKSTSPLSGN